MNLTEEEKRLFAAELAGNGADVISRWKGKALRSDTLALENEMYGEIQRILARTTPRPSVGFKIPPVIIKPEQDQIVAAAKDLYPYSQYF
jgi:hypothetical protein